MFALDACSRGVSLKSHLHWWSGVLPWGQNSWGEGWYLGDSIMKERGVTMETVQWGRGVLQWRQYNVGQGHYHVDSTVGERSLTMETRQWGRKALPWR